MQFTEMEMADVPFFATTPDVQPPCSGDGGKILKFILCIKPQKPV